MTQDEIIDMAREAGFVEYELDDGTTTAFDKRYEIFANLVEAKATEKANERANASWTLMVNKMVEAEREANIKIINETLFSKWFQADVIEAIRARG